MTKNAMNPKVDLFFNKATKWQKEYEQIENDRS